LLNKTTGEYLVDDFGGTEFALDFNAPDFQGKTVIVDLKQATLFGRIKFRAEGIAI
jgi:hypothetical protein